MKIQCPCGAKHTIEITPDMAERGATFVCPQCDLDLSSAVTALAREELGAGPPVGILIPPGAPGPATGSGRPGIRVHRSEPASQGAPIANVCLKHPGQPVKHQCVVCGKGMCAKCMEFFGYVCSPHCKAKAEAQGIEVPEFEGQRTAVEARHWRKVALGASGIASMILILVGAWFWYAWFGSHPKPAYTVAFDETAFTGESRLVGDRDLVVLHGTTLSRHDLKKKKDVWWHALTDTDPPDGEAADEKLELERIDNWPGDESFQLFVSGTNVWVAQPGKVTRYDWATGKPVHSIRTSGSGGEFVRVGDELFLFLPHEVRPSVQRIHLASGAVSSNQLELPGQGFVAAVPRAASEAASAGLPSGAPGTDRGRALDPARVAAEAQRLPLAGRLALPAVLAGNMSQERILEELESQDNPDAMRRPEPVTPANYVSVFPRREGAIQFSVRLLEKRIVSRRAMKDPPKTSVLENVSITQSMEVANELLNDLQRMRGGDVVYEDESRYFVSVRGGGTSSDWSAEVVGRPMFIPLETVNVITAGKTMFVLDKNKVKLWQAALSFPMPPKWGGLIAGDPERGLGPCAERDGTLYLFDPAVLAAFDLRTGNARWRLPSTGIASFFFDDEGMLYVNTTTASPDTVRYSRQIDLTQPVNIEVLKIDPRTGERIWSVRPGGPIECVSESFIYVVRVSDSGGGIFGRSTLPGGEDATFLKIKRLHPEDGRILWEHLQQRPPLDLQFHRNSIQVVFRDEVQVLRFLSF